MRTLHIRRQELKPADRNCVVGDLIESTDGSYWVVCAELDGGELLILRSANDMAKKTAERIRDKHPWETKTQHH